MKALSMLVRPGRTVTALASDPQMGRGTAAVVVSGLISAALGVLSTTIARGGPGAMYVALALPALFVLYWLLQAFLIDAAAGMLGRRGRRRELLAVTAYAFPAWIAYAVLGLTEAGALHIGGGAGPGVASALQWLTLPVLAWFVGLTVLCVREVYTTSALNALAFALLPSAVLTTALLVLGIVFGLLHGVGVV